MNMIIRLFFIISVFLISISAHGQWTMIPLGTTDDVHSVDYFTSNNIYITAGNDFIYSNNGGSSWINTGAPSILPTGFSLVGQLYDVKATGNGSVVSTGFFVNNNIQHILVTNNNGANWTDWIYTNASNPGLVSLNAIARRGNRVVAVGDYCKYGYSSNSGNTWSFGSLVTSYDMKDAEFISNDTVIAIGYNSVARSVNGGASWSNFYVQGDLTSVSVSPNCIYIAEDIGNRILKSTNHSGVSYNISNNLPFQSNGIVYAISDDTLLVSGDTTIYRSTDGGAVWEALVMPSYEKVNAFDYFNGELIAVGDSGFAIRNASLTTTPSRPLVNFYVSPLGVRCVGQQVTFVNTMSQAPGYTYQWKLDGRVISNQYSASYTCKLGTHTVTLSITNQFGTVERSSQFLVLGHVVPHHVFKAENESVCIGSYPTFKVPKSQIGVTYQLRSGFTPVSSPKSGNGSALTFTSTSAVYSNSRFNLLAVGSNICFTDSLVLYDSVKVETGGLLPACIPNFGSIGQGITSFQLNGITNSSTAGGSLYSDYSCQLNTSLIVGRSYSLSLAASAPGMFEVCLDLNYDGSPIEVLAVSTSPSSTFSATIVIPDTFLFFNTPLRLRVGYGTGTNLPSGCGSFFTGEYEDYSTTVLTAPVVPVPQFSMITKRSCTTAVDFINETTNVTSYLWDFGDGTTDVVRNPSHVYSLPGAYTVTLTTTNSSGSSSLSKMVTVKVPQVPITPFCTPASGGGSTSVRIASVELNGMTNSISMFPINEYKDFTCTKQAYLLRDSLYRLHFGTSYPFQGWIDYNNDGSFQHPSESLGSIVANTSQYKDFTVPSFAVLNTPLRMRLAVSSSTNGFTSSCTVNNTGQIQDYTVIIDTISRPRPDFSVSDSLVCGSEPIQFTNNTLWSASCIWDFGDGTTSTLINPVHSYQLPGDYTVKLITCDNGGLCDSVIKYDRIRVRQTDFNRYVYLCPGQQVTVGANVYSNAGVYTDTLVSTSGCDSIVILHLTINSSLTNVISALGPVSFCKGQNVVLTSPSTLTGWQWYRNNVVITGATSSTFTAYTRGLYHCLAMDAAYCSVLTSNSIQVSTPCAPEPILRITGIQSNYSVYPNPTNGTFKIEGFTGEVYVFDITGRLVVSNKQFLEGDVIDLSGNPSGIYSISMKSEQLLIQDKIVLLNQ